MWALYRNDQVLYKPGLREWPLWGCTLETRLSKSGELKFTVYADNPQFEEILRAGTINEDVYRVDFDGEAIWYGRPYQISHDVIGGCAEVSVEGEFGYLNDSVLPVYHFSGRPPESWLAYLLTQHNNQCPSHPFLVGNVTVKAPEENGNITRWTEGPKKVWDELYEKTVNSTTGGYLMLRHAGGSRYVDWVADPSVPGSQPVRLGGNLLKLVGENDGSKVTTALYAFGQVGTDPDTEEATYTTLDGYDRDRVWGGDVRKQGPYVVNIALEQRHGWVCDVYNDPEVSQPGTLLNNAIIACRALADNVNYEASAVDLRNAGYDYEMFRIGQRIPLQAGDIDRTMLVTSVTYDLTDATQGKVVFSPISMSSSAFGTAHVRSIEEGASQAAQAIQLANSSVHEVKVQYAISPSGTFAPSEDAEWFDERPETGEGEWVWERTVVTNNSGGSFSTAEEPSPADAASEAIEAHEVADEAHEIAKRIENHFWADADGVHVSREEGVAEGSRNILMDSESMLIRRGSDNLASVTEDALSFWDGAGNAPGDVLASFGRDGARIGRGNEVNSTVTPGGFAVNSGLDKIFEVAYDPEYDEAPWYFRKVYKAYYAGYMAPGDAELENAVLSYAHFTVPIGEPAAGLYFGDTWVSDGDVSGETGMLMSVQDYIDQSATYAAPGDVSEQMASRYELVEMAGTGTREYQVKYIGSEYVPFTCDFSDGVLAQIPREVWSERALEHGAPNWFFGSTYMVPVARLRLNGEEFAGAPERYADSPGRGGNATRANAILYGDVDATSTSTAFTATVEGLDALYHGAAVMLRNGVATSAAGFTIDVNGLGPKPVYSNLAAATAETTKFNASYTMLFVYDERRVAGGCWVCYSGYNSDTNTVAYNVRTNQPVGALHSQLYRYMVLFTRRDGTLLPANGSSNNTGTSKKLTTEAFDPFGPIWYYSTTTAVAAGGSPGASYMWLQYSGFDMRRAFNAGSTLEAGRPVYVRTVPLADGTVRLDGDDCIAQELPSEADGRAYIRLGVAYSSTSVQLMAHHPVYEFRDGSVREWDNAPYVEHLSNTDIDEICV